MRAPRLGAASLVAMLLAALGATPAAAAPEQLTRAEVRWRLGTTLDERLTRSCVRPRPAGGGSYTSDAYSHNGAATGTVDAAARTGGGTLTRGTLTFRKTRRAARGTRSLTLGRLGVQLDGQGGYLVARTGGSVKRIARMDRLTLSSGPIVQRGRRLPNTFRFTLSGTAQALAPLARLGDARCRGGRARTRIRTGSRVGTVSLSFPPAAAVGVGGSVGISLFLSAPRDPATGTLPAVELVPIAPAEADGELIRLPITGSAPLARRTGDAFTPTGAVTTTAGAAFVVGAARVELRDLAFGFSLANGLEGVSATIGGTRRVLATLSGGTFVADPGAMAAIAAGLGVPSVSLAQASADPSFTSTAPAPT